MDGLRFDAELGQINPVSVQSYSQKTSRSALSSSTV